ncbi:hypothetical protein QYF61_025144 [Mycteria americana]|uniref:Uncharacterized protein n=1 Tax=Mycteria americana TaxID=33587 RepID=A0AAN7SM92_MYCAM|nr:hypothetical protein QYF61_025144 [Mycteria americana]
MNRTLEETGMGRSDGGGDAGVIANDPATCSLESKVKAAKVGPEEGLLRAGQVANPNKQGTSTWAKRKEEKGMVIPGVAHRLDFSVFVHRKEQKKSYLQKESWTAWEKRTSADTNQRNSPDINGYGYTALYPVTILQMMPLTTSEMQGARLYASEIMQGMTPKYQSGEQERGHRGARPPYQMGSNPRLVEDDFQGSVDPRVPHLIQTSFKYLQGWRLHHFPGQPVPMLDNPLSEEIFPNIQSKPPLEQLEAICSHPATCYLEEETDPHLPTPSFQVVEESDKVSPQPPFLQAKQPQLPQPLLISLVLQTLPQLRCPSLDTLQPLNVSLVVGGPKLNTGFEVRPHQCRVQGHNHFPSPAGHAIFDTSQDAIGFLGRLGTLLAHIQAAVNQHPQVLLCQAAFQPLFPKPVALHGVAVAQVQDLALGLVKPHTIDLGPSIQPVQVPLQSLPTLQQINTPTQLGVICKLTESTLDPFVQITDKDVKQNWPQHRALGNTACDRPPTGVNSIHHHSLGPAVQPVLYPAKDGDSTTSLGSLFQCLITLLMKKFFMISSLNLPWCNLSRFLLSYHLLLRRRNKTHLSTPSFQRAIRSPLSLLFSRLNNPSSLSHSSSDLCSRPFTSFVALLWICASTAMSFLYPSPAAEGIQDTGSKSAVLLAEAMRLVTHIPESPNSPNCPSGKFHCTTRAKVATCSHQPSILGGHQAMPALGLHGPKD